MDLRHKYVHIWTLQIKYIILHFLSILFQSNLNKWNQLSPSLPLHPPSPLQQSFHIRRTSFLSWLVECIPKYSSYTIKTSLCRETFFFTCIIAKQLCIFGIWFWGATIVWPEDFVLQTPGLADSLLTFVSRILLFQPVASTVVNKEQLAPPVIIESHTVQ